MCVDPATHWKYYKHGVFICFQFQSVAGSRESLKQFTVNDITLLFEVSTTLEKKERKKKEKKRETF